MKLLNFLWNLFAFLYIFIWPSFSSTHMVVLLKTPSKQARFISSWFSFIRAKNRWINNQVENNQRMQTLYESFFFIFIGTQNTFFNSHILVSNIRIYMCNSLYESHCIFISHFQIITLFSKCEAYHQHQPSNAQVSDS